MPASGNAFAREGLKNVALLLLSSVFVVPDTLAVVIALLYNRLYPSVVQRRRAAVRKDVDFVPRTVLVTGVGMSKGLALARVFYEAGHDVIGADFSATACGHASTSLRHFCKLQKPTVELGSKEYVDGLLEIIVRHHVDLWVSCSGVASAVEDGEAKEIVEAKTPCKAIQFDVATTQMLHEKHTFIQRTREIGLTVPETHNITDLRSAVQALRDAPHGRKFIMKPIGMDDANRGDMTLLPKGSPKETEAHLSKLKIENSSPWILQQYINGPEYCTHSLVIDGSIKAFTACPSAELLMHYQQLPKDSKLSRAMFQFTEKFAQTHGQGFTGHLSFDFMVEETEKSDWPTLYPIECNPRAHTAVVLFNDTPELARAYLSILDTEASAIDCQDVVTPSRTDRYFWIGHDLGEFVLLPIISFSLSEPLASLHWVLDASVTFISHCLAWRDGTFEIWDPLPWWCLYHVYWPLQFWTALGTGKRWSRINVSTTKVFEC